MTRFSILAISTLCAVCLSLPATCKAVDLQSIAQQAKQAAAAGHTAQALGLYELALTQSANQPASVSGPLEGQYWALIGRTNDFPRALEFFTAFVSEQKSPSADLLANKANATGGYFGWLAKNNLLATMPPAMLQRMDASARQDYKRALTLDPDNFSALYGYAIYESYSPNPNAKAHMQQLLTKLNSLRSSHPHYPWQLVDYLEQHGHPQF
jgi:tetratricopeptide (TPR) repeat protein